ncbi:hypothetical protein JQX13_38840 [Archangium violaceum]|uniref:hypothetical protein n=1 Tax=Archangium violaceum TaxID=83451 RepID=UPI00193B93AA|nr:hypothetical protein [Archangium violaceum]QRK06040.1 hypothetical protein JQX13_38840 [Archangium violaceum]
MLSLSIREVAAMMLGMVVSDPDTRLGFVASSRESARLTGFAVAELLKSKGVVWHPAYQEVRWPSGAKAVFVSVKEPDRMRGYRWAGAFMSAAAAELADEYARHVVDSNARPPGTVVSGCAEVASRDALSELQREAA